jgi:HD-like signal output (HDOD) protein
VGASEGLRQSVDGAGGVLIPDQGAISVLYCGHLFCAVSRTEGLTRLEKEWLKERRELLNRTGESLSGLVPRLPAVMPRLMAAIREPDRISAREVAALIESDPVLAGNVLKVANSPAMRIRALEVESLEQAVVIMGLKGMREVIAAAAVSPIASFERDARIDADALREVWPGTLQVAMNVRMASERIGSGAGFELYLAALTHSSGLMILLRAMGSLSSSMPSDEFIAALEPLARSYSVAVARDWGFAEATVEALDAWARDRRTESGARVLADAIAFMRMAVLAGAGMLSRAQCEGFRRSLPDYAHDWRTDDAQGEGI